MVLHCLQTCSRFEGNRCKDSEGSPHDRERVASHWHSAERWLDPLHDSRPRYVSLRGMVLNGRLCCRGRARPILGVVTAPCAARARARRSKISYKSNLYAENIFSKTIWNKIGKILSKLTKICQKSQKLTEISQKMAKVGDFTAKIDFVERKR